MHYELGTRETSGAAAMPLAARVRPRDLAEFEGQKHLVGPDGAIVAMIGGRHLRSMILWGPPGTGKTTLAQLIARAAAVEFISINAISSGIKELRAIIDAAAENLRQGKSTVLFIDEIHRFNKSQQATLLDAVERGTVILIGATTENPSFEVITPLLSRCRVFSLEPLGETELDRIVERGLADLSRQQPVTLSPDARALLIRLSGADARVLLNALELANDFASGTAAAEISVSEIKKAFQTQHYKYDREGEEHFNTISAFIKSVRGSDPDAAVYYLARMLAAGEDPKFIARRLIVLASEDIGNAEPYGLTLATACFNAVHVVGMPEARIILSQAVTYLASCPKSNAAYLAIEEAIADVQRLPELRVPLHLRNAPTKLMKDSGYSKGYQYAHDFQGNFVEQVHLPPEIATRLYYRPSDSGREAALKKRLQELWPKRR